MARCYLLIFLCQIVILFRTDQFLADVKTAFSFFLKGATLATKQAQNAIDETIPPCLCMSVSSSYIVL